MRPTFVSFKHPNKPRRQAPLFYPPHLATQKLMLREEGTLPKIMSSIRGRGRNQTQVPLNQEPTLLSITPWAMAIDGAMIKTQVVTGSLS